MAKLTPSQGDIIAHFQPGESYALSEIVEHFGCSRAILQRELSNMPRVQRYEGKYRLIEAPEIPTWHKAAPLDLQRFYSSVIGRVADARSIPSYVPILNEGEK